MKFTLCLICVASVLGVVFSQSHESKPVKAVAYLTGPGAVRGTVTLSQKSCGEPTLVEVALSGLAPDNYYGFHVHDKGDLSDGCASLGPHYNPDSINHGGPSDQIRHVGDLGNVKSNATGFVNTIFSDTVISLTGNRSIIGRGIIVHAGKDDLGRTDHPDSLTTGNAGGRAACGVIGLAVDGLYELPECNDGSGSGTPFLAVGSLILMVALGIVGQIH